MQVEEKQKGMRVGYTLVSLLGLMFFLFLLANILG